MNNWLLSCKWMCPSVGACCVAAGSLSTRSEASLMLRSALTMCHRLSFRGPFASTLTSRGPFPTSKEKTTSEEAKERQWSEQLQVTYSERTTLVVKQSQTFKVSQSHWTLINCPFLTRSDSDVDWVRHCKSLKSLLKHHSSDFEHGENASWPHV